MKWDQVLMLLQVAKLTHEWGPNLFHIRNEAEKQLRELDASTIVHGDEQEPEEE